MTKNEIRQFVTMHLPFVYKTNKKNAKLFQRVFSSNRAHDIAIEKLSQSIYDEMNRQPFKQTTLTSAGTIIE